MAMRLSTAMDELQKLIYGLREEPLSSTELRSLLSGGTTQQIALYLEVALQREVLDPTSLLVHSIAKAVSQDSLIPIAMSLRYKANPNTYVNVPNIGTMHIIPYTYRILTYNQHEDLPILNSVIIMLIASGSKHVMPAFDSQAGRVKKPNYSSMSSLEWLQANGYETIIPRIENDFTAVDPDFLTRLGIMLARDDMITDRKKPLSLDYLPLILNHRVNIMLDELDELDKVQNGLDLGIGYLNVYVFSKFLQLASTIPSETLDKLVTLIQEYRSNNDRLSSKQLEEMLRDAINYGLNLTQEQYNIINTIDADLAQSLLNDYQQPYWRKVCRNETAIDDKLQRLIVSLGINPTLSKKDICQSLENMSQADPQQLIQANVTRQKQRISSDLARVNEYIGGSPPQLVCRNEAVSDVSPYEYSDLDLAYYRDGADAVWCFTRDTFDDLLQSNTNPYTLQPIPQLFRSKLENQREIAQELKLGDLIPISQAVTLLQENDSL
jgi:hypothetical protein